ncbi:peptide chain release factor N(5)-glutamine methyltransferase [Buchnera aphidicola]|uniref:peptide chain release factor N(5)-glutamine methyltransferase n=1 Tax=Buchnera aphidicola TaxID=9 RepID=UPI0020926B0B|nr:peptide chain release factor N(5)-glutamine methyltransferase [Buchnera aphidicola]USS94251.1 peptide chain release factor N(5)-glutamine methyltransferase [Buchnera aphidicola (Sipha maydis)]
MNIKTWKKIALKKLHKIDNFQLDIDILLSYVLKKKRSWILCFEEHVLDEKKIFFLNKLIERRLHHEPISYLIHKKEFYSLNFFISKRVLIPRPESEILVDLSLKKIPLSGDILDLGTGCGNIAISIAYYNRNCNVTGIDYQEEIIDLARYNSRKLYVKNINFFCSNWFTNLSNKKYNLIVSNPPYLSEKEYFSSKKNIFFEPVTSLFSKKDGFSDIIHIIKNAKNYLKNKGWLLIEHGWKQKKIVQDLFKKNFYIHIKTYKDLNKLNRMTLGQIIL